MNLDCGDPDQSAVWSTPILSQNKVHVHIKWCNFPSFSAWKLKMGMGLPLCNTVAILTVTYGELLIVPLDCFDVNSAKMAGRADFPILTSLDGYGWA